MPNTLFRKHRRKDWKIGKSEDWPHPAFQPFCLSAFLVIAIFFLTMSFAHAQVQPTLTAVFPQGGQQGQDVEVTLKGTNLGTATAVWFSGSSITVEEDSSLSSFLLNFSGDTTHAKHTQHLSLIHI